MYKSAIDIISRNDVDFKAIAIEVAKSNPSVFVKAFNKSTTNETNTMESGFSFFESLDMSRSKFNAVIGVIGHQSWAQKLMTLLFSDSDNPKYISAIKLYRSETGNGLKDSKYFIDELKCL